MLLVHDASPFGRALAGNHVTKGRCAKFPGGGQPVAFLRPHCHVGRGADRGCPHGWMEGMDLS